MGTTTRRVSRWIVNDGNYRSVGRRYAGAGYSKEEQRYRGDGKKRDDGLTIANSARRKPSDRSDIVAECPKGEFSG